LQETQKFLQIGKDISRKNRAGHGTHTAQHDINKEVNGSEELRHIRSDKADNQRVDTAAYAGDKSGDDKADHLVAENVNPVCVSRNFILPARLDRAAIGGTEKILQQRKNDDQRCRCEYKGQLAIQYNACGKRPSVWAACKGFKVDKYHADNFAKTKGNNCQVISGKLQHRKADEKTGDGGNNNSAKYRKRNWQPHVEIEKNAGVGADCHETGLAQGKLACDAYNHVHRHCHYRVHSAHGKNAGGIRVNDPHLHQ